MKHWKGLRLLECTVWSEVLEGLWLLKNGTKVSPISCWLSWSIWKSGGNALAKVRLLKDLVGGPCSRVLD